MAPPPSDSYERIPDASWSDSALRAMLNEFDLPTHGDKVELLARLRVALRSACGRPGEDGEDDSDDDADVPTDDGNFDADDDDGDDYAGKALRRAHDPTLGHYAGVPGDDQ